jgi:hypothetical protein
MFVSILFVSPFFASLDAQQGGQVMRDSLWWHLRNAQVFLTKHHFIRVDLYSFTTLGQSWINPWWLAEIPVHSPSAASSSSCSSSSILSSPEFYFSALPSLWGGCLNWNAHDVPVFLDRRTDIFEHHGVLLDYLKVMSLSDSFAILDRYHIGCVPLAPSSELVYLFRHSPEWKVQYEDQTAALIVRADSRDATNTH